MKIEIPRAVKDKIPHQLKKRYHETRRKNLQKESGSLEGIQKTIQSLETVPLDAYLRSQLPSVDEMAQVPDQVGELEINDSCNIDCVMCKTSLSTRKKGLMELGLFERTVEKLAARGMRSTVLHTIGDPLANKNIAKYLEILRQHKFTISNFSTNGLLLDRHMDTVFEYRDVIYNFRPSIDAASKEVYERIRFGGKWETLNRNLLAFSERNKKSSNPFPVVVNNIIAKENFHEIAMIPHVFSYLAPPTDFRYAFLNSLSPQNEYFLSQNYFEKEYVRNAPCSIIWSSVYVLKDGSLTTCCRDYNGDLVFGNIDQDSLETAYNNDKLRTIRRAHMDGDVKNMPELCQSCFMVDPRLSDLLNQIFQFFFQHVKKHPVYLQNSLDEIGGHLKSRTFSDLVIKLQSM